MQSTEQTKYTAVLRIAWFL